MGGEGRGGGGVGVGVLVCVVVVVVVVRTLCVTIVFVPGTPTVKHLIMGAVSLWTRHPALYLCTGP